MVKKLSKSYNENIHLPHQLVNQTSGALVDENEFDMILLRIFLLAFNVAVITYLVYRLLQIYRSYSPNKNWIIGIGIFLLLVPITMLFGFIKASPLYLFLYPVAISLHLYLIRNS